VGGALVSIAVLSVKLNLLPVVVRLFTYGAWCFGYIKSPIFGNMMIINL